MSATGQLLERIDSAATVEAENLFNNIVAASFSEADDDWIVFDLGKQRRAQVERDEFGDELPFAAGDEVALLIEDGDDKTWTGSVQKARKLAIWRWLESINQSGDTVEGLITAENKGGLSVDIGVRAFLPRSHVDLHPIDDTSVYLGKTDQFQVIEFDKKKGNIVVSRKKILEERQKEERKKLIDQIAVGQKYTGVVRNLTDYGAFVDIGGIDGLLHVTNMAWGRIDHPNQVLAVGDEIQVEVLKWNPKKKRLGLGRKQLLDNPWNGVTDRYEVGQVVSGKVVNLAKFGAFVALEPGLEGLVHITELSWTRRINHPGQVLSKDEEIKVKILDIDTEKQRISLSVKQLEKNPWQAVADRFSEGDKVTGPIKNITDFGLFVEIEEGVEGLVHVSDLSWTENINDPSDHYEVGQEVEVVVLDIDIEAQRMSLGIKQLDADPWSEVEEIAVPGEKIDVEITRLADFGAFAEIVDGVEGLIHISELSEERINKPAEVVRPGQKVNVLVMSYDAKKRRIGLSLKRDELPMEDADFSEYSDDEQDSGATLGDVFGDALNQASEASDS